MATVVKITKEDDAESIRRKLELITTTLNRAKEFPASKFTGKIKSFEDGIRYQQNLRNEWK